MRTQSWDTALKGDPACDYSSCTTWIFEDGKHYLIDVFRGQLDYPELRRKALELHAKFSPGAILIEAMGSGFSLAQELKSGPSPLPVIERKPDKDKVVRLAAVAPLFEAGMIYLPKSAPWLTEYEKELLGFPGARYDDQVDSTSQYLNWFNERDRSSRFNCWWPDGPPGAPSGDELLSWARM
jgi:predicted phage terminase large subunit-like protein